MSSPPLRVFLTREQDRTLFEMRTATTVRQRTKDRAEALRLSNQGWKVDKIAKHFKWAESTVRQTIHRWQHDGLGGLWDGTRPGRHRQWQEDDLVYLEQGLEQEQRTYSSPQLALETQTRTQRASESVPPTAAAKKKGFGWKRTRHSNHNKQDPDDRLPLAC